MNAPQIRRPRRKVKVTMIVQRGSRTLEGDEAKAALLEAGRSDDVRQAAEDREPSEPEDRSAMGRAALAIEGRLVRAFATIARQPIPVNATAPRAARRNGLDYFHENVDSLARFIDAAAGRWESVDKSRPSLPSPVAIDDANAAVDWLLLIEDESLRRILVVGATSKRGDVKRRIQWERLRVSLPQWSDRSTKTMQRAYSKAIGVILEELTLRGMKK
jgi:hypothetical protein